jgi:hypothetical protein
VGAGAVVSPALTERLVQGFGLVFRPLKQPQVSWRAAMFVRHRPSVSPAVESFVRFALDYVGRWAALAHRPEGPVRKRSARSRA